MHKRALFTALSLGLLASSALAQGPATPTETQGPVTLTEAQMDRVSAGQVDVVVESSRISVSIDEIVNVEVTAVPPENGDEGGTGAPTD